MVEKKTSNANSPATVGLGVEYVDEVVEHTAYLQMYSSFDRKNIIEEKNSQEGKKQKQNETMKMLFYKIKEQSE